MSYQGQQLMKDFKKRPLESTFSVLYSALKPDWNVSEISLISSRDWNWRKTFFCRILDRKESLEIGLKFENTVALRFVCFVLFFLRNGFTMVWLRSAGMVLIMVKTVGPIVSKTLLSLTLLKERGNNSVTGHSQTHLHLTPF